MRLTHSPFDRRHLEALAQRRVLDHLGLHDHKRKATAGSSPRSSWPPPRG